MNIMLIQQTSDCMAQASDTVRSLIDFIFLLLSVFDFFFLYTITVYYQQALLANLWHYVIQYIN